MMQRLWCWVRRNIPEGKVLPPWALVLRAILFPLDYFYWRMGKACGYQYDCDVWIINGVRYSPEGLRLLAESDGQAYRISRRGDVVCIEQIGEKGGDPAEWPEDLRVREWPR